MMSMSAEQRHWRAQIANRSRYAPDDPQLDYARQQLRAATVERHVRLLLDQFATLTREQQERIAALLRPVDDGGGAA